MDAESRRAIAGTLALGVIVAWAIAVLLPRQQDRPSSLPATAQPGSSGNVDPSRPATLGSTLPKRPAEDDSIPDPPPPVLARAIIRGRAVQRPGGAPVPGARVELLLLELGGQHSARSNDDGTFLIAGLEPGRYRIDALAPNLRGHAHAAVFVGVGETSAEILVELDRASAVSARVRESGTHTPCPAGEVRLREVRSHETDVAVIEPTGELHFPGVPPGTYTVDVDCEGHIDRQDRAPMIVLDRALAGITWDVDRGSELRGLVVDVDGMPVGGADVSAAPEADDVGGGASAVTDARGVFALRGLASGKYDVAASAFERGSDAAARVVVDGHSDLENVTLTLGRGATIEGRVVDVDGAPAGGAKVNVSGSSSNYRTAEARPDGRFLMTGLPAGEFTITLQSRALPLRLADEGRDGADRARRITLSEGGSANLDLLVERRASVLEGWVVGDLGEPIPDVIVEPNRLEDRKGLRSGRTYHNRATASSALTDANGFFRIPRLADAEYAIRAHRPDGCEGNVDRVRAGSRPIVIVLVQ